ncbi:hypothetical protein LTR04_006888, partial [Oleoguttula sp. CCFEE 6159]
VYTNPKTGTPIEYYEIDIKPLEQQIYPGRGKAKLWGYDGISPGPTFHMTRGREAVVRFINHGQNPNSVHLHGSYSRAPFDGWAEDTTEVGQYKDYYYPNAQAARTLWYHDHAEYHTAENAYYGQAGFYILEDGNPLGLPVGDYDLPLSLAGKQYQANGDLFSPNTETTSLYGDVIHVNGQPWPFHNVEPRKYRLRFLDTSISRAFKLYFEADGALGTKIPFTIIASDAGLLTKPVPTDNLEISMAERWEAIIDFSPFAGKNVTLRNSRNVQADTDYLHTDKVMRFVVGKSVSSQQGNGDLPAKLRDVPFPPSRTGVDRTFKFERSGGQWQINGVTFSNVANRILAKPPRGAIEVWDLENGSGGWSHPVHIHLVDFQIISRTGGRSVTPYEKEALKDVVLLGTGETVRVIARYAPWDGVYMFHCHNLIHEDHDMMAAFNVSSLADFNYPETTKFIDPMEEQWRSRPISAADSDDSAIRAKLEMFQGLDAYNKADQIEGALQKYYSTKAAAAPPATAPAATAPVQPSTIATSATDTTSVAVATTSPAATTPATTPAPVPTPSATSAASSTLATSVTTSDDKRKTSTTITSTSKTSTTKTSTTKTTTVKTTTSRAARIRGRSY